MAHACGLVWPMLAMAGERGRRAHASRGGDMAHAVRVAGMAHACCERAGWKGPYS